MSRLLSRPALGLLVLVSLLVRAGPSAAQEATGPVEKLRDVLQLLDKEQRERLLPDAVAKLKSLGDLRRALQLNWPAPDDPWRVAVAKRFTASVQAIVA